MIEKVISAANEAAVILKDLYRSGNYQKQTKDDGSPVTSADLASHALLADRLPQILSVPVVSEEDSASHLIQASRYWLIDPLDGTRDFLGKTDEFSINIALMEGDSPVLGLLCAPILGEMYYAERGKGAFTRTAGKTERLPLKVNPSRILVKSRHHDSPKVAEFGRLNNVDEEFVVGSALKFNRLAAGEATLYPRFFESWTWDIAPGHCILLEAGGSVMDLIVGGELKFGQQNRRNSPFLACAKGCKAQDFQIPEWSGR